MYLSEGCKAEICKELKITTETFTGQKNTIIDVFLLVKQVLVY